LSAIRSALGLSAEAAADINALYAAELGRAADAGGLAAFQQSLANGSSLSAIRSALGLSAEAASNINTMYVTELGRTADPGGLAFFQQSLANGSSLSAERSAIASGPEAVGDMQSTFQSLVAATVDPGLLATLENILASGAGAIAKVGSAMLSSAAIQGGLAGDYDQLLGRDPTSAELSAETSELANDATGVTSPTWQGLFAAIDNGFTKFLTEVNPIGSAIAASATTSPAQRAANLAAAKAALADPNVAAMIKTLQAAENGSFNGINGTQPPVSDLKSLP